MSAFFFAVAIVSLLNPKIQKMADRQDFYDRSDTIDLICHNSFSLPECTTQHTFT